MDIGNKNISGSVEIRDFDITFGTITLSADNQQMIIPYKGLAFPVLTNVSLTVYQFSVDNGTTWTAMTPSGDTVLSSLTFSAYPGTDQTFKWEVKDDIGTAFYNTTVRLKFQARSGVTDSDEANTSVLFERSTTNVAASAGISPFPDDYSGMDGRDLMKLAPRA